MSKMTIMINNHGDHDNHDDHDESSLMSMMMMMMMILMTNRNVFCEDKKYISNYSKKSRNLCWLGCWIGW